MKVIVREGHEINLVTVDVWVRAGSANETAANNGISHMVEHMLFKATKRFGPGQIDRELEGVGAELNGGTSRDWVHFYTTVASKYLPTAVDLLGDALSNPEFRQEDMDKERQVVLDEIARAESDPAHRALDLFYRTAFSAHPYKFSPTGDRDTVNKLTRDDLVGYYNQRYLPANTCVSIAGDVTRDDAVKLVAQAFSGYGRNGKDATPASIAVEPPIPSPRVQHFRGSSSQAYLVLGYLVPPASEAVEGCTLDVILAIIGDTYQGRIAADLNAARVKFTRIDTDYINQRYPTVFTVTAAVEPSDVERAASVILTEFARLRVESVSEGELVMAKQKVVGGDLFQQETFSGQARSLGLYESIASYSLALKYGAVASQINSSDVLFTAAKYFGPSNYCLVVVDPGAGGK